MNAFVALDIAVAAAIEEDPDLVLTALADYLIRASVGVLASRGACTHQAILIYGEGFDRHITISEEKR